MGPLTEAPSPLKSADWSTQRYFSLVLIVCGPWVPWLSPWLSPTPPLFLSLDSLHAEQLFVFTAKKKRSNDSDEVVITDLLDPVAKRHGQPVIITTNRENKSPSVRPRPIVLLPPPRPDDSNGFGLPLSVIIDKTPKVPARFAMFSFLFSVTFQDSGTLTEMEAWTFILSGVNFDHPFKGKR